MFEPSQHTPPAPLPSAPWVVSLRAVADEPDADLATIASFAERVGVLVTSIRRGRPPVDPAAPGSILVVVGQNGKARSTDHRGEIDAQTWSKAVSSVVSGKSFQVQQLGGDCQLTFFGPLAGRPYVQASMECATDSEADDIATRFLAALVDDVESGKAAISGHVHIDSTDEPYEKLVRSFSQLDRWGPADPVDGYYWALLLSKSQIATLGGANKIKQDAPVSRVEAVGDGRLLCVLTSTCADLRPDVFLAWRAFLKPVLAPGFPGPEPSRYERRGTWIFEGPRVPRLARNRLLSPGSPTATWPVISSTPATGAGNRWTVAWSPDPGVDLPEAALAVGGAWLLLGETEGVGGANLRRLGDVRRSRDTMLLDLELTEGSIDDALEPLAAAIGTLAPSGRDGGHYGVIELRPFT